MEMFGSMFQLEVGGLRVFALGRQVLKDWFMFMLRLCWVSI